MRYFYMMRHGETLFNMRGKIQGDCDSPLTKLGQEQAIQVREYFKNINIDHFYSSTSERASDTLELVMGEDTYYKRVKGLKERSFGLFEGESEDLNPNWENGYEDVFPKYGGETSEDVSKRLRDTCIGIMEETKVGDVFAVSHAGASYHFMRNWVTQGEMKEIFEEGGFPNGCVVKYRYKNGLFRMEEIYRLENRGA